MSNSKTAQTREFWEIVGVLEPGLQVDHEMTLKDNEWPDSSAQIYPITFLESFKNSEAVAFLEMYDDDMVLVTGTWITFTPGTDRIYQVAAIDNVGLGLDLHHRAHPERFHESLKDFVGKLPYVERQSTLQPIGNEGSAAFWLGREEGNKILAASDENLNDLEDDHEAGMFLCGLLLALSQELKEGKAGGVSVRFQIPDPATHLMMEEMLGLLDIPLVTGLGKEVCYEF